MLEECELCNKRAVISDVVLDGQFVKLCKTCATINQAIVLSRPTEQQLVEAERAHTIKERLMKASGLEKEQPHLTNIPNIVDNFSFVIRTAREKANLTQKQLANTIAVPDQLITNIERGVLQDEVIARKLEQFLKINLMQKGEEVKKEEKHKEKEELDINLMANHLTIGDLQRMREEKGKEKEKP